MAIPHVFHQVWVGPDPLPEEFTGYRQTWLDHHPGWELHLWTDRNLPGGFRRPEVYERIRSPVERCDILRLELLFRFGGVYVDTDFECLRPIDPLIEGLDFFAADIERGRVNHAILGAVAGHPILDRALDEIRPREFFGYDKESTGPLFFDRILKDYPEAKVLEKRYFYAKGEAARRHGYALHHDANSWKTPEQLRLQAEKARTRARKAKEETERWRSKYAESEAKLDRVRRASWPLLALGRLVRRR
jgi:mannosyltransferase OCH1-like enzyme